MTFLQLFQYRFLFRLLSYFHIRHLTTGAKKKVLIHNSFLRRQNYLSPPGITAQRDAPRPRVFHGAGADTDIIVASAKAYLDGLSRVGHMQKVAGRVATASTP